MPDCTAAFCLAGKVAGWQTLQSWEKRLAGSCCKQQAVQVKCCHLSAVQTAAAHSALLLLLLLLAAAAASLAAAAAAASCKVYQERLLR
jgi:hypothetical protein